MTTAIASPANDYISLGGIGISIQPIDVSNSSGIYQLGSKGIAQDGTVYQYVYFANAVTIGEALVTNTGDSTSGTLPFSVTPSSAGAQAIVGIAPFAYAAGSYGWMAVYGTAAALVASSTAAGAQLGSSATAGTLTTLTASSTVTQAQAQAAIAAASGIGITAVTAEGGNGWSTCWLA